MSRNAGKRPHELLLQIMQVGTTLAPTEIDKHVGNGPYASKHIWFLGKLGFKFDIVKQGRTVVSYTLLSEPANAASIRNPVVATKVVKTKATPVAKKVAKSAPTKVAITAAKTKTKKVKVDAVTKQFGTSGEVSSYGVDADWDSMEGVDVRSLVA